jgi:hypothetical protein
VALGDHRLHLSLPELCPVDGALKRIVDVGTRLAGSAPALDVALVEEGEVERLEDDGAKHDAQDYQVRRQTVLVVGRLVALVELGSDNVPDG